MRDVAGISPTDKNDISFSRLQHVCTQKMDSSRHDPLLDHDFLPDINIGGGLGSRKNRIDDCGHFSGTGSLYFLARYLVSGFADEVWINETCIRFEKNGQQETTSLTNIEELKSYYFRSGFPFNFRQYLVRIRFTEPIEMGKQIRFFIRSPAPGGLHHEKEILEILIANIKATQANPPAQHAD